MQKMVVKKGHFWYFSIVVMMLNLKTAGEYKWSFLWGGRDGGAC